MVTMYTTVRVQLMQQMVFQYTLKKIFKKTVNIFKINILNALRIELIDEKNNKYLITAIYRLHCTKIIEFVKSFGKYPDENNSNDKHIITGDLNIDLLKYKYEIIDYVSLLSKFEFLSRINIIIRPNKKKVAVVLIIYFLRESKIVKPITYTT